MESINRTFKAAVFDMDGLILDSERTVLSIWEQIGDKYGFPGISFYQGTNPICEGSILMISSPSRTLFQVPPHWV